MKTADIKYENTLLSQGHTKIAGIDEVGRGPLAGPVVAGIVIMPPGLQIPGVYDSKALSEKKRQSIAEEIKSSSICWSLGWADEKLIDEINILQATYVAMARALESLKTRPDALLIDGLKGSWIPDIPSQFIKGGDQASHSIAAASILAKVARDEYMQKYHEIYPQYGFVDNKGYGTAKHRDAIRNIGACPIHRQSFLNKVKTGFYGQDVAAKYLQDKGLKLLEANYRVPRAEIDLIMQDGDYIVFVEVKYRRSTSHGLPREAIGTAKQKKILRAAEYYVTRSNNPDQDQAYRFDAVEVLETARGQQINHIENAFW